ncbi:MAG: hypothetical protein AAGJ46_13035 [Planctomycetota bacterium]
MTATGNRTARAAATASSTTAFTLTTMLVGFVATPYFLLWLGEERYGAFRALTDWGAYIQLLELGLSGALGAVVSRAAIAGPEALRDAVAAGGRAYRRVAVWGVLAGVALAIAAPWIIPVEASLVFELRLAAAIGATTVLGFLVAAARPALEALQQGYFVSGALAVQSLVITAMGLLLAANGGGLPGMALATAIGAAVFALVLLVALAARSSELPLAMLRGGSSTPLQGELQRLRRPTFLLRLCGTIATLSDNIIVAWILGPAAVVPFFLTQRLPHLASDQVKGLGAASWAGLAEIHHNGDADLFRERTLELTRIIVAGSMTVLGAVLLINDSFVTLWVGGERYAGAAFTVLAVVNGGLLSVLTLWIALFTGTGRPQALVPISVSAAAVNLVVSVAATFGLGAIGPLVGSFAGMFGVYLLCTPRLMRREFGLPVRSVVMSVVAPLVMASPPILAAAFSLRHFPGGDGWLRLAFEFVVVASASMVWNWFFVLSGDERHRWKSRLRRN